MPRSETEVLRTAVEPRRLEILQLIWEEERTVGDIADALPVSMAAVSQHLAKLRSAGLVSVRAEGRRRYYRASKADMGSLAVVLESFWADRLGALDRLARELETRVPTSDRPVGAETDPSTEITS